MSKRSAPFRIWSYCSSATLRPKLIEAGCEFVREPESAEAQVREVTNTGLKVMFLPTYEVRVAQRGEESEDAARARIYDVVNACEAEQDEREQAEAERTADAQLSKVLNHAIKVQWVLYRPNTPPEEVVTLELRRPSPREKRLFEDAAGNLATYEAEEVLESHDEHVRYRVTSRVR
jgi:hypothetical protein